jgi:hypothetical protein
MKEPDESKNNCARVCTDKGVHLSLMYNKYLLKYVRTSKRISEYNLKYKCIWVSYKKNCARVQFNLIQGHSAFEHVQTKESDESHIKYNCARVCAHDLRVKFKIQGQRSASEYKQNCARVCAHEQVHLRAQFNLIQGYSARVCRDKGAHLSLK